VVIRGKRVDKRWRFQVVIEARKKPLDRCYKRREAVGDGDRDGWRTWDLVTRCEACSSSAVSFGQRGARTLEN
jgi:hypothetical protein